MKSLTITKAQIVTFLFLLCFISLKAQDYRTIRVNGTIVIERNNIPLQTGTTFEEEDDLLFKTPNSIATVINSEKGRFVLRPDDTDLAYARANFTPAMSNISSRSGAFMTALDIKNHISGDYVFFDEMFLIINKDVFPMNEDKFFFLRYNYEGEKVNKMLSFNQDSLFINTSEVFTVDDKKINYELVEEIELWYMERDEGNKITMLSSFNPVVINNEELKNELSIIFDVYADRPEEKRRQEAFSFVQEFYGTSNQENFDNWLIKHMEK